MANSNHQNGAGHEDLKLEGTIRVDLTPNTGHKWGQPRLPSELEAADTQKNKKKGFFARFKKNPSPVNPLTEKYGDTKEDPAKIRAEISGYIIASLIGCVFIAFLGFWLINSQRTLFPWELQNLEIIKYYKNALLSANFTLFFKAPLNEFFMPVPPAYYWLMAVVYIIVPSLPCMLMVQSSFFIIMAVSIYGVVRLARPRYNAWLAAFVVCAFPFIFSSATTLSPDFMLYALTAASYACFMRSANFSSLKYTLLFTLCASLGFITGWLYLLYILPIAAMSLISMGNNKASAKKITVLSFVFIVLWLAANFGGALNGLGGLQFLKPVPGAENLSLANHIFWYLWAGASMLGPVLFLAALGASIRLFFDKEDNFEFKSELVLWFFIPYFLLTLIPNKMPHYFGGALLCAAVAIAITPIKGVKEFSGIFCIALMLLNIGGVNEKYFTLGGRKMVFWGTQNSERTVGQPAILYEQMLHLSAGKFALCALAGPDEDQARSAALYNGALNIEFKKFDTQDLFMPQFVLFSLNEDEDGGKPVYNYINKYYDRVLHVSGADDISYSLYKIKQFPKPGVKNTLAYKNIKLGGYVFENLTIKLGQWNSDKGYFDNATLSAKLIEKDGADIMSPVIRLDKVSFTADNYSSLSNLKITALSKLVIEEGLVQEYSLSKYASNRYTYTPDINLQIRPTGFVYIDNGVPYDRTAVLPGAEDGEPEIKASVDSSVKVYNYSGHSKREIYFNIKQSYRPSSLVTAGSWRNLKRLAPGHYRKVLPEEAAINFSGLPSAARPYEIELKKIVLKSGNMLIGNVK